MAFSCRSRDTANSVLVSSFVRTDRECSPLSTAARQPAHVPVFARSDRSRRLRAIGSDERQALAKVRDFWPAQGRVRSELTNIDSPSARAAVADHEQLRSELANKTMLGASMPRTALTDLLHIPARASPARDT